LDTLLATASTTNVKTTNSNSAITAEPSGMDRGRIMQPSLTAVVYRREQERSFTLLRRVTTSNQPLKVHTPKRASYNARAVIRITHAWRHNYRCPGFIGCRSAPFLLSYLRQNSHQGDAELPRARATEPLRLGVLCTSSLRGVGWFLLTLRCLRDLPQKQRRPAHPCARQHCTDS
jgi:hypothetical protein